MENEFTCSECGKTYPKEWSDEEAMAEMFADYPDLVSAALIVANVICDDCWKKMRNIDD